MLVSSTEVFPQICSLSSSANCNLACFNELWTIRTLANSALINSDPKKFGPSQFGHRPLVNSDPDHWSIRTLFYWSIRTSKIKILWSIRTFPVGQFGPFPLVNSEIRTFSVGQFGPFPLVNSDLLSLVNSNLFHWSIWTFALCIFHKENCVQLKNEPSFTSFLPFCMTVSHFIRYEPIAIYAE